MANVQAAVLGLEHKAQKWGSTQSCSNGPISKLTSGVQEELY